MTAGSRRGCSVCGGEENELLHRQSFLLPGERLTHYDVVACKGCGFTYANDIPSAEEYDAYYRANRKYTYEGSQNVAGDLRRIHRGSFEMLDRALSLPPFPGRDSLILDVGCSTGSLLACFKEAGYQRLLGLDPTPECREIGRRLYDVEIATDTISAFDPGRRYDAVLLSSVVEHLPNAREAVERVASFVNETGLLFVQVPDAESFGVDLREPFLEFSIEHINYFTGASLESLLAAVGFAPREMRPEVLAYGGASYPALTALFERRPEASTLQLVPSDTAPLRRYIARSAAKLLELEETIASFVESQEEVVVWGVGSLTARLLATTDLGRMNIKLFVDSNSGLQGRRLAGREIVSPGVLAGGATTVFVSTFVYGEAIRRILLDEYRYSGRIVLI